MQLLSRFTRPGKRAFTLVEVLVVLVVVGALAAVAVPAFQGQGSKGTDSEAKSMAVMAAKTIEACAAEHGGSYAELLEGRARCDGAKPQRRGATG